MRSKSRHAAALLLAVLSFMPFSGCGGRSERTLPAREELDPCDPEPCALAWDTCCPPCGGTDRSHYHAVSRTRRVEVFEEWCPNLHPCFACQVPYPPVVAACTQRGCEVLDLARDPAIACTVDSDCRVRTKDCCECGGDTSHAALIAISDELRYSELVCPTTGGCNDCAPNYTNAPTPRCEAGRCTLRQ